MNTNNHILRWMFVVSLAAIVLPACGGGGGGAPPPPPPPSYLIDTAGGDGGDTGGTGGNGGQIDIVKFGGIGPIEALNSGTVNAGFTPATTTANLGTNPLSVTTDTTLWLDPVVPPPVGTPYLVTGQTDLFISDGTTGQTATGLSVASGVTLTLSLNSGGGTVAYVIFSDDVDNRGTITTLDPSNAQRGAVNIECNSYIGASGSAIDTSGVLDGQIGGNITVATMSAFYNQGTITAAGANHPAGIGGNGGVIALSARQDLENTGTVSSSGGNSTGATGGAGNTISMDTWNGHLYNSGELTASGGDGDIGGDADQILLSTGVQGILNGSAGSGALRNSGALTASGGRGAAGNGGPGGLVRIYALQDGLLFDADITVKGGDTLGSGSHGGTGGSVEVNEFPGVNASDFTTQAGDLLLSGNITTTGGFTPATGSGSGGDGGTLMIRLDASGSVFINLPVFTSQGISLTPGGGPASPRLALRDFRSLNTSGGQGNTGGNGGAVNVIDNGEAWNGSLVPPYQFIDDPGGDVINEVDIATRGGSVYTTASITPALAGRGGSVLLSTDTDLTAVNTLGEYLTNSGAVDSYGGDSLALTAAPGFNGGSIGLLATNNAQNSGALTANGGSDLVDDDTLGTGFGHDPGEVTIISLQGTLSNTGAINANGGDGEDHGASGATGISGLAGIVLSAGTNLTNSAALSVRGGDADVNLTGSQGGNGGVIAGAAGGTTTNTGSVDISGGSGDTSGSIGTSNI